MEKRREAEEVELCVASRCGRAAHGAPRGMVYGRLKRAKDTRRRSLQRMVRGELLKIEDLGRRRPKRSEVLSKNKGKLTLSCLK